MHQNAPITVHVLVSVFSPGTCAVCGRICILLGQNYEFRHFCDTCFVHWPRCVAVKSDTCKWFTIICRENNQEVCSLARITDVLSPALYILKGIFR